MTTTRSILIAYDGSADARHAVDEAAALLPSTRATILYVRQPLESMAAHLEGHPALQEVRSIAAEDQDAAEQLAAAGADYARSLGLDAEARVATSIESVGDTIVAVADEVDAALVVLGARGRRGLASLLLGSVSHHVLHHTRRSALVIPSPALADARGRATQVPAAA